MMYMGIEESAILDGISPHTWLSNKPSLPFLRALLPGHSKNFILTATCICLCFCFSTPALWAQTSSSPGDASNSGSDIIESQGGNVNPLRTSETHTQSGNRTTDTRSLQRLGSDGNYEPYQDVETVTEKVSATATRTITHTYGRDADGAKTLLQVTEEERNTPAGGDSKIVRSVSNPDANGNLQLVQRQIEETKKTGKNIEETKTSTMLPGGTGELAEAMKTQERRQVAADGTIDSQKTTLLPDGNGNWQVDEVKRSTIRQEGKTRSSDETTSRSDLDGNLNTTSRTVTKESEDAPGETQKTEDTYSIDVPGLPRDGALHAVKRVSTKERAGSAGGQAAGGQTIEQEVEKTNPGDPEAGLRVTAITIDTTQPDSSGTRATRTIQARDANDDLNVVSLDTAQTNKSTAVQVQIAPADKPK
jgi:hypothetical protein